MTDPTASPSGKVAQLTPEEWKQLVLLNAAQLQNYLQSIPGNTEGGASGLNDGNLALIDAHIARGRSFMRAWSLARLTVPQQATAPQPQAQDGAPAPEQANGAEPAPKRTGGWPKGKKRTPKHPVAPS